MISSLKPLTKHLVLVGYCTGSLLFLLSKGSVCIPLLWDHLTSNLKNSGLQSSLDPYLFAAVSRGLGTGLCVNANITTRQVVLEVIK